jgi:hypothetical protein
LSIVAQPNSLTANWLRIGSIGLAECIRKVVELADWKQRFRRLPAGRGVGLACSAYLCGAGLPIYWNRMPQSGVQLLADRSGQVTVFCGATEIGQGSDDVLAAIVAEVLGIDAYDVRLVTGDTGLTPVDLGSYSSRVTVMMGNAAIQAAERVRALVADAAAEHLEVSPERIAFAAGRVFLAGDAGKGMSFREAIELAEAKFGTLGAVGSYAPPRAPGRYKGAGVGPSPAYSYTACVVEVEVDEATGWITVPKVWIAHDIGRTINPVLARGQVEGSVYMGLGEALMEEQAFRRLPPKLSGALVHKIPSILEYKSPTALDMPEVVTVLVEDPDPNCPFGAKEAGQGPLLPVAPALANAVYDAVGVRIDEVPITPDKVLKALERKAAGQAPRVGPERFPVVPYPEPVIVPPPWEGGDGKEVKQPGQALAGAAHRGGGRAHPRGRRPECDADRRRDRPSPQHEAPPAGARDARVLAPRRGHEEDRERGRAHARCRADPDRARRRRGRARELPGAVAGRGAGRDGPPAQHGHARRQPLPRHPLQLLQPELRVAQGDRLLPEEGR